MLIAVSGAQGTGKSTDVFKIANFLKLKYKTKDVIIISEIARKCSTPINEQVSIQTEEWMIISQIQKELEYTQKYDIVVSDRSVIDYMVYTKYLYPELYDKYKNIFEYWVSKYKLILFKPVKYFGEYLYDDGVRSTNKKFQTDIDKMFYQIFDEFDFSNIVYKVKNDIDLEIYLTLKT